jgi:hypothetical protein
MSIGTVESRNHAAFDETMARHFQQIAVIVNRNNAKRFPQF